VLTYCAINETLSRRLNRDANRTLSCDGSARRRCCQAGSLWAYGVNGSASFHRAATFVDKILKGAKPGVLLIELPNKLELVINLKTARILGISVPPALLDRGDEVIK
jgi:putative tryptophan/tyrosine transport system substrate-binding protein